MSHRLIALANAVQTRSPSLLDPLLIGVEVAARQIYWRSGWLPQRLGGWRQQDGVEVRIERQRLYDRLEQCGVRTGALVMVHASMDGLVIDAEHAEQGPLKTAGRLVEDLSAMIGESGTLAMPTHALYRNDPGFMHDKSSLVCEYNPRRTASRVGLLAEVFRRFPGTKRSLHPISPLACRGSLADKLLAGNLNDERPLPHGEHSGYYRFCQRGGLTVSINTPLINALTIVHTPEEVRDTEWPVDDFFYERRFRIKDGSDLQERIVRERRPIWVRNIALGQLRRDLLRTGILRETTVDGVRVDYARADELLDFMMQRNACSTYPYYGIGTDPSVRSPP